MNFKLKLKAIEKRAREIFGENFISLGETEAVFGKTLSEKELSSFCSFSISDEELRRYEKDGFRLIAVPQKMTLKEICSAAPGLCVFGIYGREMVALSNRSISPGWYLIRNEPKSISFNGLVMREGEMASLFPKNPEVVLMAYAYVLCHLLGKRKFLIERICIICREEVQSKMYGKLHISFQKKPDAVIQIGIRTNQMSIPNFLPTQKV